MDFILDILHTINISNSPVYRFLSEGAGTGKRYVLKAIRECVERHFKTKPVLILISNRQRLLLQRERLLS